MAWHRGAHKASPYTATFCLSDVQSSQKVMSQLTNCFRILQSQNLTETEVADGVRRKVVVLSRDSNAESQHFNDYAYDFVGVNNIEHWDFQLWLPVLNRFGHGNKTGAERFYETTGVLGSEDHSVTLHNASNDAWAQVATLIRFFHVSEECFSRWVRAEEDLKPLDMSWVNRQILHYNAALEHKYKRFLNQNGPSGVSLAMRPAPPGQVTNRNGHHHQSPNPPPAANGTAAFPGLPARTQTTKAPAKTVWGAKSDTQDLFKAKESRATGKGIGTERLNRPETKQRPATCWSRPLTFVPSTNTTSPSSSSPQSTTSSTPPSTVPSASTSRSPSPPTPTINSNAPASSSTATIVNNGSNDFQSHHESASARNCGNGAAGPAKEDGQCSSKKEPQKKRGGRKKKKKKQVMWEL